MAKIKICAEPNCSNAATTEGFCRLHYLRNWKLIKEEVRQRAAKKLNRYIDHVMRKHPDKYVEIIKKDLRSPLFDRYIEESFGENAEAASPADEAAYEEEVEELIRQLKIEKGF